MSTRKADSMNAEDVAEMALAYSTETETVTWQPAIIKAAEPLVAERDRYKAALEKIANAPLPHQEIKVDGEWKTLASTIAHLALAQNGSPAPEEPNE
jgi:hypothetical protein